MKNSKYGQKKLTTNNIICYLVRMNNRVESIVSKIITSSIATLSLSSCVTAAAEPFEGKQVDILASENSDVCLTMEVDPNIWPVSPAMDATKHFSHLFLTQMSQAYRTANGQYAGVNQKVDPFISNSDGENPQCQDKYIDIIIIARYTAVDEYKNISFQFSISKGDAFFEETIENIGLRGMSEPGHSQLNMSQFSLLDDMRKRSASIVELIGLSG